MRAVRLGIAAAVAAAALLVFPATAPRPPQHARRATGKIATAPWPYLPGSIVPVRVDGFPVPYHVALVGPGSLLADGRYVIPVDAPPGSATLVAGNAAGLAERSVHIGSVPSFEHDMLAVASYDDGILFHDARTFAVLGLLATGGTPSDVAGDGAGHIAATDTQGPAITLIGAAPWNVTHVQDVPFGDEVAFDRRTGAIFVTNRDVRGAGALTRVDAGGHISQVATGLTAEGLAIDERR
ncbi:MAG TPA: hypothetical protein VNG31_03280, partial [Candidatus Baltobacteraceae bacterium]|nr:hypothetical protein [Candidatus Baltobacteraceae bacterium]